jgi:peptide chain release factor 2
MNELDEQSQSPTLWDTPSIAQKILKEKDTLKESIHRIEKLDNELKSAIEMLEMDDPEFQSEGESILKNLAKEADRLQLETLLSGEADNCDAFVEVNAGAGGTEAQDWASMLSRMYQRWAEGRKFSIEILDENEGEEAGIKNVSLKISGKQAYGWLKTETGVHRLVRISPFDANDRRHTSFASVLVTPVVDDTINIVIEDKDLRVDTYRASGAGGQHVNKTDSAIRITHLPTNVVVQCQNDRSQHRNRATAMNMLKSKLYELEIRMREEKANSSINKTEIGWGHQIRSYVLQPYQLVKDLRTSVEKGNAHGVLDGDIDVFLEAALAHRIGEKE